MKNERSGLYIHVPFCLSKCGYCSFYSIKSIGLMPEFIRALKNEMEFYKNKFPSFDTIYIGGGTPSLLSIEQLDVIFKAINILFKIDSHAEITMEVNPGDVSIDYFQGLRSLGVNRVNIGIQSFDDAILKFLGRRHTAKDSIAAMDSSRKAGFINVGIDLIYGVYQQTISAWKRTLQKAVSFTPEHISCYQLSLEARTPLYQRYYAEEIKLPAEEQQLEFFLSTAAQLEDAGYIHYEISNFARNENLRSKHNMKYWRHAPYLGLGPAAHSFFGNKRWWNKSAVKTYIKDVSAGKIPMESSEELSAEQLQLETLFLGLRTKEGIDLQFYKAIYGKDLLEEEKKITIDSLLKDNLVEVKNGFLCPKLAGMAVADSLALI